MSAALTQSSARRFRLGASAAVAVTLLVGAAGAQTTAPASLSNVAGTVVDPTHTPLVGVAVSLEDPRRRVTHVVRTGPDGRFEARDLPAGDYELELDVPGFAGIRESMLLAGPLVERHIVLAIGRLTETVTVSGSASGSATAPRAVRREAPAGGPCTLRVDDATQMPLGGQLRPPRMLTRVTPAFPAHLQESQTAGTVELDARIGTNGAVSELHITSATHDEFAAAAEEAVREWTWEETRLNCEPVETDLTVYVQFVPAALN
jgi:hypothetical protein